MLGLSRAALPALSRDVTTRRLRDLILQLGSIICDRNTVLTSFPYAMQSEVDIDLADPLVALECGIEEHETPIDTITFPYVWRDRVSAHTRLAATPEARSLNSL